MDAQVLIIHITQRLQQVDGLFGIVLGGSRARGTHTPTSDIDLGLYYDPTTPLDQVIAILEEIAQECAALVAAAQV